MPASPLTVSFPAPGRQDCFPAAEGEPFMAHGPNPASGTVVASARIIIGTTAYAGVRLAAADFVDPNNEFLDNFPNHKTLGSSDDNWAFRWAFDSTTLPADTPMVLVITCANVSGPFEVIIPFEYIVP